MQFLTQTLHSEAREEEEKEAHKKTTRLEQKKQKAKPTPTLMG